MDSIFNICYKFLKTFYLIQNNKFFNFFFLKRRISKYYYQCNIITRIRCEDLQICFKTMKLFRLQLKTIKVKIKVIVLILLLNIFMYADYYWNQFIRFRKSKIRTITLIFTLIVLSCKRNSFIVLKQICKSSHLILKI